MSATRIGIVGAGGRMGRMLIEATLKGEGVVLGAAFDVPGSPAIGKNAGELVGLPGDVLITDDVAAGLKHIDVLIDFTRPQGTLVHLELCRKAGVGMVIGTTGFEADGKAAITAAARDIPVVFAPNMAVGVNVVFKLLDMAARIMNQGYDIEVVEAHHRMKIDAPSGTAEQTAQMIAEVRKAHKQGNPDEFEKLAGARGADYEGMRIHSVRLPGYVAHQEVIFGGLGQTLTIRHDSMNRESFMPGVVLAASKVRSLTGLTIGLENLLD